MRRRSLGLLAALLGLSAFASESKAQVPFTNVNDPFFAYYSFYLPRQQAQAASPGPEATINALTANRQQFAATNRNDFLDPGGSGRDFFGNDSDNFALNSGARRRTISSMPSVSRFGNLNGLGPQGYYNKRELSSYYPTLRAGRGRNANVSVLRSGKGYSGGFGGIGGVGLPGPR